MTDDKRACLSEPLQPGEQYQHYKGGLYVALELAQMSENRAELVVVYRSLATGDTWVRPLRTPGADSWEDPVVWPDGVTRPRFVRRSSERHGEDT